MQLILPWPPKQCFPNFKRAHHWRAYRNHVKQYRADCGWWAKTVPTPSRYDFIITFYPPNRRMDDDNIISGFKHGRDGLADGWGVNDKYFKPTYVFQEPVKGGKIVVSLLDYSGENMTDKELKHELIGPQPVRQLTHIPCGESHASINGNRRGVKHD